MNHVMIDLETLGTAQDAAIISVGACRFDVMTGEIGDTFYRRVDWDSALKTRSVTGSTIKWWLQQSKDAISEIVAPGLGYSEVLWSFSDWIRTTTPGADRVWGNGSTFDISILENAFREKELPMPWHYWNTRDVRTIADLASHLINKHEIPFEGTAHNALDDAKHQAKYVAAMYAAIKEGR